MCTRGEGVRDVRQPWPPLRPAQRMPGTVLGLEGAKALAHKVDVVGAHEGQAVHGNIEAAVRQRHL